MARFAIFGLSIIYEHQTRSPNVYEMETENLVFEKMAPGDEEDTSNDEEGYSDERKSGDSDSQDQVMNNDRIDEPNSSDPGHQRSIGRTKMRGCTSNGAATIPPSPVFEARIEHVIAALSLGTGSGYLERVSYPAPSSL
ncbi:MAG: hypothetical protein Q9218_005256 [Villophora microphyllina]